MLDLWSQAETPGITHFGAYLRSLEGHFYRLRTEDWDVLATTRLMCFNECVIVGMCFGYHSTEKAFRLDHKKGGVGTMETGSIHPPPSGSELSPHDTFIKARHWSAPPVIILKPFEGFWGHKYQLLEWYNWVGVGATFWWKLSKAKVFQFPKPNLQGHFDVLVLKLCHYKKSPSNDIYPTPFLPKIWSLNERFFSGRFKIK